MAQMDAFNGRLQITLAAAGVLSHLFFFRRIRIKNRGPRLVSTVLVPPAILFGALYYVSNVAYSDAATSTAIWYGSFMSGMILSMLVYRGFFHRLGHYPGPFMARLTQWYHVWSVREKVDNFKHLERLHMEYGDFVRVGPNLLSIADPTIVNVVHGFNTKFAKGDWYEASAPLTSLQQMTDHALHDKRRRHGWDKAFTASAIRAYDSRIKKYTNQLITQLRRHSGQAIDIQEWIGFFAFDVMGDLAFGQSFDALEKGVSHWFIDAIRDGMAPVGTIGTLPWLVSVLVSLPIPASMNPMVQLVNYSSALVEKRKENKPDEPDVMSHILEAGQFFDNKHNEKLLLDGDARLLVVAGSDTTAATLTYVIYQIAKDPSIAERLRDELAEHNMRNDDSLTLVAMAHLPFLNAIINETLRLYPPVPGGVYRHSPKGGINLNGHFIPEGCVVVTPQHVIQRSPKAFAKPDEFIPERWTTQTEMILNKDAFFPFSLGRYGCIGKQLAYNELRNVISRLVLEFDVAFAKGEDGSRLLYETKDQFTLGLGGLNVVFTSRE